jgi:hypothetical protein
MPSEKWYEPLERIQNEDEDRVPFTLLLFAPSFVLHPSQQLCVYLSLSVEPHLRVATRATPFLGPIKVVNGHVVEA